MEQKTAKAQFQGLADYYYLQIMLLGDPGCGRTSLSERYFHDEFAESRNESREDWTSCGKYLYMDDITIELVVYDVKLGLYDFPARPVSKMDGILLCYDTTYEKKNSSILSWLNTIKVAENEKKFPIDGVSLVLVGCKNDLTGSKGGRDQDAISLTYNIDLLRTSSKDNEYINETFFNLVSKIIAKKQKKDQNRTKQLEEIFYKRIAFYPGKTLFIYWLLNVFTKPQVSLERDGLKLHEGNKSEENQENEENNERKDGVQLSEGNKSEETQENEENTEKTENEHGQVKAGLMGQIEEGINSEVEGFNGSIVLSLCLDVRTEIFKKYFVKFYLEKFKNNFRQ